MKDVLSRVSFFCMEKFHVYILYSGALDRYYVGSTGNLSDRMKRHNGGRSKYTRAGVPWQLVHTEEFNRRSLAVQREMEIKRISSRKYIESLIDSE